MTLQINDIAPDFESDTTEGHIHFHDWIGNSWAVLFSHPKDFTPVCTTELGYMAKLKPEFDRRNTKIIGLSVDPVSDHTRWAQDIKETQGYAPNYPMIGDPDLKISKAYGTVTGERRLELARAHAGGQSNRPQCVRDRARQADQAHHSLSDDDRAQFRRGASSARFAAAHYQAPGRNPGELESGRGRDHRRLGLRRGGEKNLSARLEGAAALYSHRASAVGLASGLSSPSRLNAWVS